MKFGFSLSNNQGVEDVQAIVRLAIRAEELGSDREANRETVPGHHSLILHWTPAAQIRSPDRPVPQSTAPPTCSRWR